MFPVLFEIGGFTITTFGLMMFLSFIAGAWVLSRQIEQRGHDRDIAWDVLIWIMVGGILGAKVYYLALHWRDVVANPAGMIFSRGGLVWYGGLIGGVLAYYWQIRKRGLPVATMFDATAPALFLAIAIGRMGCFLVGDDYGVPTDGWYGVAFPRGAPPSTAGHFRSIGVEVPPGLPDNAVLTVHPTQLYEIALVLPLFALLWHLGKRAMAPGRLFALFLGLYAIERFLIEFVRAKDDRFLLGLSTSQGVSLVLVVIALVIWFRQANVPPFRADPAAEGKAASAAARR